MTLHAAEVVYSGVLEPLEYESLRQRPEGKPLMLQSWRDLLFLHFPVPIDEVSRLLPSGLQADTFPDSSGREMAWIGLVPFWMKGIRAQGWPALPWLSGFCETNVRTYVHRDGKEPGVWFFSLDASRMVACQTARRLYSLNYLFAFMRAVRTESETRYSSRRVFSSGSSKVSATLGPSLEQPEFGSFEYFAVERYLLYSQHRNSLMTGRVWHEPYRLRRVTDFTAEESLVRAAGLKTHPFTHAVFSEGVDVQVFPLAEKRPMLTGP